MLGDEVPAARCAGALIEELCQMVDDDPAKGTEAEDAFLDEATNARTVEIGEELDAIGGFSGNRLDIDNGRQHVPDLACLVVNAFPALGGGGDEFRPGAFQLPDPAEKPINDGGIVGAPGHRLHAVIRCPDL